MLLNELHIYKDVYFENTKNLELTFKEVPVDRGNGDLVDIHRKKFAHIKYFDKAYEGGYGILTKGKREDLSGNIHSIMIKEPQQADSLAGEALIQWYARKTLQKYGLEHAIPKVYDIFSKSGCISFAMEFIQGCFPYQYIEDALSPDIVFLQMLSQVAIVCYILQKDILLDHRDLKANNVFIRKKNIKYEVELENHIYRLQCPFEVVFLDFGFACLGNTDKISKINLAGRTMPWNDPCPKIGRDLFHFICSLWSIPTIRNKMTSPLKKEVQEWLFYDGQYYSEWMEKYEQPNLSFAITAEKEFQKTSLDSVSLLKKIHEKFPDVLKKF